MGEAQAATAYVALGGNVGDVLAAFRAAVAALVAAGAEVTRLSSAYRTRALTATADDEQADYWNAVCELRTRLAPDELMALLLHIEAAGGRERRRRWAPRTLDLDLLLYDQRIVRSDTLQLPHPRLHQRAFVLRPLTDIAPALPVPRQSATVAELLALLDDPTDGILERRTDWFEAPVV